MRDTQVTKRLVQSWVATVDDRGRTRMEARWTTSEPAQSRIVSVAHDTHAA